MYGTISYMIDCETRFRHRRILQTFLFCTVLDSKYLEDNVRLQCSKNSINCFIIAVKINDISRDDVLLSMRTLANCNTFTETLEFEYCDLHRASNKTV